MDRQKPVIFEKYPHLEKRVPWIPILTHVPTEVERLTELEKYLNLTHGEVYIKRDDKDHHIYGGNKLRKFEFIFGDALKRNKKGIITLGGIGSNHALAAAIITKELGLNCKLYLSLQPLTWHVQRSLLLYNYFNAKVHLSKSFEISLFKSVMFRLFHRKYYLMSFGGTPLFGIGTPLGSIGFINAIFELKQQIDQNLLPEPDIIFVAAGSTGTAAGLTAGCKLLGLKTKVYFVKVSLKMVVNPSALMKIANKSIKYLQKRDKSIPDVLITEDDFKMVDGYMGSAYGVKTKSSQKAVDVLNELEGKKRDFRLETTYTGKAMAALLDHFSLKENEHQKVLFWNTYNSNDMDSYLKKTNFNYRQLKKKFHQFFEKKQFQCWQVADCIQNIRESCPAYLNHEYRFWEVIRCQLSENQQENAKKILEDVVSLEKS